ncbi:MAG TPA: hypothetical protein PK252_00825 [Bacteroidales bacterium]|nr:hypothetical protein [Bacteroidales bacterium]
MRVLFTVLSLLFVVQAFSQKKTPPKRDTTYLAEVKLDYHLLADTVAIDTSINHLHNLKNYQKPEKSYSYLTYNGYPSLSNDLSDRLTMNTNFYPSIAMYFRETPELSFYHLNKTFSSVTYKIAGGLSDKEEYAGVRFAKSLGKNSSIGVDYNFYSYAATNEIPSASNHHFIINYFKKRESIDSYLQLFWNSTTLQESGGVKNDTLINYKNGDFKGVAVNLETAKSRYRGMGFSTFHQLHFLQGINDDSTNFFNKIKSGSITYKLDVNSQKKLYKETEMDTVSFYKHNYYASKISNDSLSLTTIENAVILKSPELWKYLPNFVGSIHVGYYSAFRGCVPDTLIINGTHFNPPFPQKNNIYIPGFDSANAKGAPLYGYRTYTGQLSNDTIVLKGNADKSFSDYYKFWFTAGIEKSIKRMKGKLVWESHLAGYNIGDQRLDARLWMNKDTNSYFSFDAGFVSELHKPSFMYNSLFSNHFMWNKGDNFKREYKQRIYGSISADKLNTTISGNYHIISNMVYFDAEGVTQTSKTLHVASITFSNTLRLWKFETTNAITFQEFDNSYFQVPQMVYYNSTNIQHTFRFSTGGKLYARLGFDVKYESSYTPETYIPSLGVFALTSANEKVSKTGDYPVVDVHLTFKVKVVSFFFKYSHINAGFYKKNTFVAAHYPLMIPVMQYGLTWNFYN